MAQTRTLYNVYRPHEFADVVGQEIPVKTMMNALATGNVASAYLFSGPRGVGKTTTARIFARGILCLDHGRSQPDGCGACQSCKEFDEGFASDFIEIDAATNRGIDNIRTLQEQIYLSPRISDHKVVLIDEVHHLTSEASTSLLKILEEPPAGVVFMLATTDPFKVPATIRSRTQWLRFKPMEARQIEGRLSYVLGREGREADDGVVQMVARRADGGMRDALSDLDMLCTYARDGRITLEMAERCFGAVGTDVLGKLVDCVVNRDLANALGFTVRHRSADFTAKDMALSLLDVLSLALIVAHCGVDGAVALEGSTPAQTAMAQKLVDGIGVERVTLASDVVERSLWKFDVPSLEDAHVFNEMILAVADPSMDPKHLRLDEQDRDAIAKTRKKVDAVAKAVNTLVEFQKKQITKN